MNPERLFVTVDRFETDEAGHQLAVLVFDDGQQLILHASRLPDGCQAGTVLTIELTPDLHETKQRLSRVKQVQSRLFGTRPTE